MGKELVEVPAKGGFSFDLCRRNEMLVKKGMQPPTFRKTGTTIVGLIFKVNFETFSIFLFNRNLCVWFVKLIFVYAIEITP